MSNTYLCAIVTSFAEALNGGLLVASVILFSACLTLALLGKRVVGAVAWLTGSLPFLTLFLLAVRTFTMNGGSEGSPTHYYGSTV